jgi:mRNA-degrading endonuclease RelE of RelBE toxin-antitoxin system
MEFRIADTFTDSLARLTGDEQKAVKTTAFDLQLNPSNPGMSFHKLDKAKDKNFWSVRVNSDIRLIVHRSETSLLLCYVDHHDKAYDWAERRKLETHPKTGAAQLVEIRETVKEIVVPVYVQTETAAPPNRPPKRSPFLPTGQTMNCSGMACLPSGSRMSRRRPRTRCWSLPTTCPPKPPKPSWNWRREASRVCLNSQRPPRRLSITRTRSAASE